MKKWILAAIVATATAYCRPGSVFPADYCHLDFSTYLGGDDEEIAYGVALDDTKNIYVAGYTKSSDFPVANAYQGTNEWAEDAFISKFSSAGTTLIFSTYLGGASTDKAYAIVMDAPHGQFLITGQTLSCNFPIRNGFQTACSGNGDAFVTSFSSTGSALIFSSFLGGTGSDIGHGIGIDYYGYPYVAGETVSDDFPTRNCYQAARRGGKDGFITELTPSGSGLYYSTYLGGSSDESVADIAINTAGEAFATGATWSSDFPTVNAYQSNTPDTSAFVSKLSISGSYLHYSTHLGGSGDDSGSGIFVDAYNCAYVVGSTDSSDFPTFNSYQDSKAGGYDVFVTCLGSPGFTLVYSSYLGGSSNDLGSDVQAEGDYTEVFVCGTTASSDFPVVSPYQASFNGGTPYGDVFYTHLIPDSGPLRIYRSTYLGGNTEDRAWGIVLDYSGECAYLVGETNSVDFPLRTPYQTTYGGWIDDGFVSRVGWGPASARNQYHTDFDSDGVSDIAVFRSAEGLWAVRGVTRVYFGNSLDFAAVADYDGDGVTDIATYRPSTGMWAVRNITRVYFGQSLDQHRPWDYDGDGRADFCVFRPDGGIWAVRSVTRAYFGTWGDIACPGYFDSDNRADMAIFRAYEGLWSLRGITRFNLGQDGDLPVAGDYGGAGVFKAGIYRQGNGLWRVRDFTAAYFGANSYACPAAYSGVADQIGVYQPNQTLWAVKDMTRVYFGGYQDYPVTR